MRKFAEEYPDFEFVQEVLAQITWYHNIILMDKIGNIEERKWYIKEIVQNGWSSNMLKMQINGKVYERQELAEKIGITQANLSILKNNKGKAIRFSTLDKICEVLNCKPGDILDYDEGEMDND